VEATLTINVRGIGARVWGIDSLQVCIFSMIPHKSLLNSFSCRRICNLSFLRRTRTKFITQISDD
jgi:hypothetical protein